MPAWSVYLLRNERNALYTGASSDVHRRLQQHRNKRGKAARFTRACQTLELVYHCEVGPRSLALRVEAKIKKLAKAEKERLVTAAPDPKQLLERLGLNPQSGD